MANEIALQNCYGCNALFWALARPASYTRKPRHQPMSSLKLMSKIRTATRRIFCRRRKPTSRNSGGKYIGGGMNKAIGFVGTPPPNRVVLLQFADMDTAKAFEDKQKRIETEVGNKYASFRVIGIEGVEQK
jgi:uncharacterized protein (DUF1330 family)